MKFLKPLLTTILLCFLCSHIQAQNHFFAGYTIGKYFFTEPTPEVTAAKFNLGWDVAISEDQRQLKMVVGSGNYALDKAFEWRSFPSGATFGFMFGEENIGVMARFSMLDNKSGGERTNLTTGLKEKLTLKTNSTTISFNFLFIPIEYVKPFVGFDIGRNTMSYWYENATEEIRKTRLGYKTTISGQYKPGGKGFNMRLNAGAVVKIFEAGNFGAEAIFQYQYVLPPLSGSINTWSGEDGTITPPDYHFNHNNLSLSMALTIGL